MDSALSCSAGCYYYVAPVTRLRALSRAMYQRGVAKPAPGRKPGRDKRPAPADREAKRPGRDDDDEEDE